MYSLQTLFCKLYTDTYPGKSEMASPIFCIAEGMFIFLFTWAWQGFQFQADKITLLLGVTNALTLWGYNTFLIKAGSRGSYAFMNLMMLFGGILVPLLYSAVVLGDPIKGIQGLGILLMLTASVLMNLKQIHLKGTDWTYYLFCLVLFLLNGLYGVLLKAQTEYNDAQSREMIMLTFGIMAVLATIRLAIQEKNAFPKAFSMTKKCALWMLLCLVCAGLAINAMVLVLPLVNVGVFYTVENGGVLLLSAIYSIVLFREKPSFGSVMGIVLAAVSLTLMSA